MITFLLFFISLRFCMLHVLPHMAAARQEVDGGDGTEEGADDRSRRRRVRFRLGDLRRGRRRRVSCVCLFFLISPWYGTLLGILFVRVCSFSLTGLHYVEGW